MLTEGRTPLSQRVSECRRARGRGGVQSGLRSSSLPSWCLSCCGNVYVGAGDKGPLSPYFSFIHRSAWKGNSPKFAAVGNFTRSVTSRDRGFPCFPSPEELAYGEQQAR